MKCFRVCGDDCWHPLEITSFPFVRNLLGHCLTAVFTLQLVALDTDLSLFALLKLEILKDRDSIFEGDTIPSEWNSERNQREMDLDDN